MLKMQIQTFFLCWLSATLTTKQNRKNIVNIVKKVNNFNKKFREKEKIKRQTVERVRKKYLIN